MGDVIEEKSNNEIDLVDLLKIILRNKKIILIVWLLIFLLGILTGITVIKKTKENMVRSFNVRELNYFINQNEFKIDTNIEDFLKNDKFMETFYKESLIKDIMKSKGLEQKDIFNAVYELKKTNDSYTLKILGKDKMENEKLDLIFFKIISQYIYEFYGEILKKDFVTYKNQSDENKNQLAKIQTIIENLSKENTEKTIDDLRELNPTIFSEKDAITKVYSENYKAKEDLGNAINQLKNLIVIESSLNQDEGKLSLNLIFIISNVLGLFMGIFIVFLKEFVKGVNWKELKNI